VHACLDDLVIALYVTIDELLGPAGGRAAHPSWPTASSSAWPSPRSCSATAPNAAGCALLGGAWATCSPTCAEEFKSSKPCEQRPCSGGFDSRPPPRERQADDDLAWWTRRSGRRVTLSSASTNRTRVTPLVGTAASTAPAVMCYD
jgi:hypothetical protein